MKRLVFVVLAFLILSSCTSVLRKDLMERGVRNFSLDQLVRNPEPYKGKLFILGGIIAETTLTETDSVVNALYVPIDFAGYPKDVKPNGRFLALYPKERGILDPLIYGMHRKITVAGIFTGTEPGKIGQMNYIFPVFRVEEMYLWEKSESYPWCAYGPYPYRDPCYWGSPWWPYYN
ncbi:MAG: Outer membrane lipoprotein Slp family protein [Syntrophorhabdus sp. PtaU1.Bin050]|nr:MAG: Outer membrane lipoprotein Slp family protein [Syntrophorhabdus sp. PtaU1.Bin050]